MRFGTKSKAFIFIFRFGHSTLFSKRSFFNNFMKYNYINIYKCDSFAALTVRLHHRSRNRVELCGNELFMIMAAPNIKHPFFSLYLYRQEERTHSHINNKFWVESTPAMIAYVWENRIVSKLVCAFNSMFNVHLDIFFFWTKFKKIFNAEPIRWLFFISSSTPLSLDFSLFLS